MGPEKLRIDWSGFYKDVRQKTPKLYITWEFKLAVVESVLILVVFRGPDLTETLPDPGKNYVPEGPVQVEFCASRNSIFVWLTVYLHQRECSWNENSSILEPDGPRHYLSAACVIAQKYSSSHFAAAREPANNKVCGPLPGKLGRPWSEYLCDLDIRITNDFLTPWPIKSHDRELNPQVM